MKLIHLLKLSLQQLKNELENIYYSYKFKLIGFRFHKEKTNGANHILIKSLETDQTFKLTI